MTFVTSGLAVAGLVAVAVPILIHLLSRQRRKPIEWAAMRFLLQAFRKHRRRLRLEQFILLGIRCLMLALLGAALARPLLESGGLVDLGGSRTVFLVIDNGMAAATRDAAGQPALDRHIAAALEVVGQLRAGDVAGVITAARPAASLLVPPSGDLTAVSGVVRAIAPAQSPSDPSGALTLLRHAMDATPGDRERTLVYLLSDFRRGSGPVESPLPAMVAELAERATLLAAPAAVEPVTNIQVAAVEPVRSVVLLNAEDGAGQVSVRLQRTGGELPADVTTVRLAGNAVGSNQVRTIQWQPGQSHADAEFMVRFTGAEREAAMIASIDDDPLPADNQRHVAVEMRNRLRLVLIDRPTFGVESGIDRLRAGQWIRRALEPAASDRAAARVGASRDDSPIELIEAAPAAIEPSDLRQADAAVLTRPDLLRAEGWPVLRAFVDAGGLLLICPPGETNVHLWPDHLVADLGLPWRVARETEHLAQAMPLAEEQPASELLRMISGDLSELAAPVIVQRRLPVDENDTHAHAALRLADGAPLLISGSPQPATDAAPEAGQPSGRGIVVYLAISPELEWSNLPTKPMMVPLFHEIVRQGTSLIRRTHRVEVGDRPPLGVSRAAADLIGPDERAIAIEPGGRPARPLDAAGLYRVVDAAKQPIGMVAVNVDVAAGQTETQSQAAVLQWLGGAAGGSAWQVLDAREPAAALRAIRAGASLSGLLLALVLVLVLVETVLARWFSHAMARVGEPELFGGTHGGSAAAGAAA